MRPLTTTLPPGKWRELNRKAPLLERRYSDVQLAKLSGEATEEISPRALVLLELEIRRTLALEAIAAALKEIGR